MRQFLTNKSVLGERFMVEFNLVLSHQSTTSWQEVGAAFLSLKTIRKQAGSLYNLLWRMAIRLISRPTAMMGSDAAWHLNMSR
jgi:hypothetical protein